MLLVVTESRECGVKEQRDPVNMGTFLNGVFKRESHDTGDPSTPPDEKTPSGSGMTGQVLIKCGVFGSWVGLRYVIRRK